MRQFMLLLHESMDALQQYSPTQLQNIVEEYAQWAQSLQRNNQFAGGHELKPQKSILRKEKEQILMDGPFTESKEMIGGYFIIQAASFEEAVQIAHQCPHLNYGGSIELRELVLNEPAND